jgi:PhnB protein
MAFHPYLFFSDGRCKEAFTRYQEIFGGQLDVMTNADVPEGDRMPGVGAELVMHAALMDGDALLMGSDDPTGDGGPRVGASVSYSAADDATGRRVFEALAEGGEVTLPYGETFWSKGFGMCTDRFGVPWMVGIDAPPEA